MRDAAEFFKVLSDESRLQILWLLFNNDELCVCDIMAVLDITQSKASRHLATLRHAGLVADRRDGPWSYYRAREPRSQFNRDQLAALRLQMVSLSSAAELTERLQDWMKRKAVAADASGAGCCAPGSAACANGSGGCVPVRGI